MPYYDKRILLYEFHGRVLNEQEFEKQSDFQIVSQLNEKSGSIARDIQNGITHLLPPSVSVEVNITFKQGSIDFTGVVAILQWMDLLGGSIGFAVLLSQVLRMVIERVIRQWLPNARSVQVRIVPQRYDDREVPIFERHDTLSTLWMMTAGNSTLLIILLILFIVQMLR